MGESPSATLFIIIGAGGLGLGWLLWEVSKLFAKPLAIIVPFVIGGTVAAGGGDALQFNPGLATALGVVGAIVSAILTQMFLLVGNIASLESQLAEIRRILGPDLPATLKSVEMALAPVAGSGPVADHTIKASEASVAVTVTVNGEGSWLLKLFASSDESAYPDATGNSKDDHLVQGNPQASRLKVNFGWEASEERFWWAVLYRNQRAVWRTEVVDRERSKAPAGKADPPAH